MYSTLAVSRNEKFFRNPLDFDPDRWNRDAIHPFSILPFGLGAKGCWGKAVNNKCVLYAYFIINTGRRFAEVEMKVFLALVRIMFCMNTTRSYFSQLCHNYKMESIETPSAQMKVKEKLFTRPLKPIRIRFIRRQ